VRRRNRDAESGGALGTAGWLFAELAFVLVVIALGASELTASEPRQDVPPVSAAPSEPPPAVPVGLDICSQTFRLPADRLGDPVSSAAAFQEEMLRLGLGPDVRAGLVLLFGVPRDGAPGGGMPESRALKSALEGAALPHLVGAEIRPYIGRGDLGSVDVEVFVVTGDLDPGSPVRSACAP
jgi:hypothetical protein